LSPAAAPPAMTELIGRTRRGEPLHPEDFSFLCSGYLGGSIPDYQVAAWLMAVCYRGLSAAETLAYTQALVASGEVLDWSELEGPVVDKHSTGGVGDKTSIVLVPLVAAAGLNFVKMSGRGLGHSGGTLDKLESIPGFRVELSLEEMRRQVRRIGCALVGQSGELVPADGALYALRDVTGTVESLPLIAASVMSKKLAGGAGAIVLDVKHGSGAFMASRAEARELAHAMVRIGGDAGRSVRAVLSPMHQPLGRAVGNALEVREAIDTLRGEGPPELWELTLELGAHQLEMAGVAPLAEARERLTAVRASGAALERLLQLTEAQGGDPAVIEHPERLPRAEVIVPLVYDGDPGFLARVDARRVAEAALQLGTGRRSKGERIDAAVGVVALRRVGDPVHRGDALLEVHARSRAQAAEAVASLAAAVEVVPEPPDRGEEQLEVITHDGGGV
jgi:pyrimidine-nucleoside phosphorylase